MWHLPGRKFPLQLSFAQRCSLSIAIRCSRPRKPSFGRTLVNDPSVSVAVNAAFQIWSTSCRKPSILISDKALWKCSFRDIFAMAFVPRYLAHKKPFFRASSSYQHLNINPNVLICEIAFLQNRSHYSILERLGAFSRAKSSNPSNISNRNSAFTKASAVFKLHHFLSVLGNAPFWRI